MRCIMSRMFIMHLIILLFIPAPPFIIPAPPFRLFNPPIPCMAPPCIIWRCRCHAHPHGGDRPQLTQLPHRTGPAPGSPTVVAATPASLSSQTRRACCCCSDRACVHEDGGGAEDGEAGQARGEDATLLDVLASFDLLRQLAQRCGSGMLRMARIVVQRRSAGMNARHDTMLCKPSPSERLRHARACQGVV